MVEDPLKGQLEFPTVSAPPPPTKPISIREAIVKPSSPEYGLAVFAREKGLIGDEIKDIRFSRNETVYRSGVETPVHFSIQNYGPKSMQVEAAASEASISLIGFPIQRATGTWDFFFAPVPKYPTRVLIPDLPPEDITSFSAPVRPWKSEDWEQGDIDPKQIVSMIVTSRKSLVFPNYAKSPYDPWELLLNTPGVDLPDYVRQALLSTKSDKNNEMKHNFV